MTTNSTQTDDGVKETLRIMKLVGYVIVFTTGCLLNVLLLLAVTRKRLRHKNSSKTFIIIMQNLGVADILLLVSTIPFDAAWHEVETFPFGAGMCKFLWPFQTACFQAIVFTYVILSFHRAYGVKTRLFGQMKSVYGYLVVVVVWIASIATVIPYMLFLKHTSGRVDSCDEDWELIKHRQTYTVFLFLLQYLIPLLIMLVLYFITFRELKAYSHPRDTTISRRTDRHGRVNLMLILYLVVFAILLLPHQIMWFQLDFGNGRNKLHFYDVLNFLYVFTYTITVTNVVFFFAFNDEFKSDMWYFLRCYCVRDRPYSVEEDVSESFSMEGNIYQAQDSNMDNGAVLLEPYSRSLGSTKFTPAVTREAQYSPASSMEV